MTPLPGRASRQAGNGPQSPVGALRQIVPPPGQRVEPLADQAGGGGEALSVSSQPAEVVPLGGRTQEAPGSVRRCPRCGALALPEAIAWDARLLEDAPRHRPLGSRRPPARDASRRRLRERPPRGPLAPPRRSPGSSRSRPTAGTRTTRARRRPFARPLDPSAANPGSRWSRRRTRLRAPGFSADGERHGTRPTRRLPGPRRGMGPPGETHRPAPRATPRGRSRSARLPALRPPAHRCRHGPSRSSRSRSPPCSPPPWRARCRRWRRSPTRGCRGTRTGFGASGPPCWRRRRQSPPPGNRGRRRSSRALWLPQAWAGV